MQNKITKSTFYFSFSFILEFKKKRLCDTKTVEQWEGKRRKKKNEEKRKDKN